MSFTTENHEPESLFHGLDDQGDGEPDDTAARVAMRYAGVMRSPSPKVTTDDVKALLKTKGILAVTVEWLQPIDTSKVEFVGKDAQAVEVVRGLVVVKAAIENGTIAVHADVRKENPNQVHAARPPVSALFARRPRRPR